MNLALVRAFVAVAEARSFTAAAKQLGVPTSSVSRSISRLEQELGAKLILRTTRSSSLSAAGRVYYEHARGAIALLEEGESRLGELLGQPRGEVKVTIPINLDQGFLARRLVEFSRAHPGVKLRVVPTNRWVDIREEGVDVALRIMQDAGDADLVVRELGRFVAWLVSSRAYLRAHGVPQSPADLVRHQFVNMQSYAFPLRLRGPHGAETIEVAGSILANDMHFARQLVEQGAGIGPLIFPPGERPSPAKTLVRVLPDYVIEGPRLCVVSAVSRSQPLRVKLLRDFLVEAYASDRRQTGSGEQ